MDDFGRMRTTYFNMNSNTSWIMESLGKNSDELYACDTLKLVRVFQLGLVSQDHWKRGCFFVSFYIKRETDSNQDIFDSKLTLSKFKKAYAEKYFFPEDIENDPLLVNEISDLDWNQQSQDIMFHHSIAFKARAFSSLAEKGKTKTYCFVGVSLEKT